MGGEPETNIHPGRSRHEGGRLTEVNSPETTSSKRPLDDEVRKTVGSLGSSYLERGLLRLYWPLRLLQDLVLRLDPFVQGGTLCRYRCAVLEREGEGGARQGGSIGRGRRRSVGRVDNPVVSDVQFGGHSFYHEAQRPERTARGALEGERRGEDKGGRMGRREEAETATSRPIVLWAPRGACRHTMSSLFSVSEDEATLFPLRSVDHRLASVRE